MYAMYNIVWFLDAEARPNQNRQTKTETVGTIGKHQNHCASCYAIKCEVRAARAIY
jgi:hypothetical protein